MDAIRTEGWGDEFVALLAAVKKAEAEAVAARVRQINLAAMSGTWQAAAWWLERRHPDLYGSERRRIRELERIVADILKGGGGAAHPLVIGGVADSADC